MVERCDYFVPPFVGHDADLTDIKDGTCVLNEKHKGPHLVRGNNSYVAWRYVEECPEPEYCADQINCDHFEYWTISDEEAKKRIATEGPS